MDLVGQHQHVVALADVQHSGQLRLGPDAADGVVGGAEDEHLHLVFGNGLLELLKVQGVVALVVVQVAGDQLPAGVQDGVIEGIVHRGADDDRGILLGVGAHRGVEGTHHAGGEADILLG